MIPQTKQNKRFRNKFNIDESNEQMTGIIPNRDKIKNKIETVL